MILLLCRQDYFEDKKKMSEIKFFTIGVYESTEESFFNTLVDNKIDLFCDIRMRRAVRGPKYAYVNSNKLQAKLSELGINYRYLNELAPTKEIREIQLKFDEQHGVKQSDRSSVCDDYIEAYTGQILDTFDFTAFLAELKESGVKKAVFFCVEKNPYGCHRSIVLDAIKEKGFEVEHLD